MKKNYFILLITFFHLVFVYTTNAKESVVTIKSKNQVSRAIPANEQKKYLEIAQQNLTLGKSYYKSKKYPQALKNFNTSISIYKKFNPDTNLALAYYFGGLTYIELNNFQNSEHYFTQSDSIFSKYALQNIVVDLNLNRAKIYIRKKQYDLAKIPLLNIISLQHKPDLIKPKTDAYFLLGQIENTFKNDIALDYLEKSLSLNASTEDLDQKSKIMLEISKYYKSKHEYDLAYSFLEEHFQIKSHLAEIKNAKSDLIAYKRFKKNELLNEVHERQKEKAKVANQEKYTQLVSILAISLISILSLLSLSLYKNNIIRAQNNLALKEKNVELIIAKNKAEKASKARAEFLSTVSHELRTPLNAINGISHILLEDNPKKSQIGYLNSLKFSGNYLTTFINEILEINRIESNKLEIENISFNLKELMSNIKSSLKQLAIENNNEFKLIVDDKIPDHIIGDPTKLAQIMMNLINNALKFTTNGKVEIITLLKSVEENNRVLLSFEIKDTGIGIPADKLQTVFESFSQGSVEVNRKYGGTGLGLTIVKKLVEILGGKIKLKSEVGKGSTFSFMLSFGVESNAEAKKEIIRIFDESIFKAKKILLVEDNKINQMITKKMLENKEIECLIIDNGETAIEDLKTNTYDLVLMDVHLPGINGTTATQKIREFDKVTPIIALTAISLEENRETLLSFGMNDVITKPFNPEEFYEIIAKHFNVN